MRKWSTVLRTLVYTDDNKQLLQKIRNDSIA